MSSESGHYLLPPSPHLHEKKTYLVCVCVAKVIFRRSMAPAHLLKESFIREEKGE